MENAFEDLIDSFLKNNVGIANHFLNPELANRLKTNLLQLFDQNQLFESSTGNAEKIKLNTAIRGDAIYWLDRKHNNESENAFFDLIDDFIKYLNLSCYAGITDCEFHYSLYEDGSFYRKHLDQFKNNQSRQFSLISYLNENWIEKDGGELLIYQDENNQKISPELGKTVFFRSSELVHEVLLTNKRRMSITGWLLRK